MKSRHAAPYVVSVIVSLLAVLLIWAFAFSPKLGEASDLSRQAQDARTADAELSGRAAALAAKVKDLPAEQGRVADFNKAFPSDTAQQGLISSIMGAASAAGVAVTGVNPGQPGNAAASGQAAPTPAASPAPSAPSNSSDPGAALGSAPAAAKAPDTSKVLATVPVTINASGDQAKLIDFMQKVETLDRPFTVSEVSLVSGNDGTRLTLTGSSFLTAPLPLPSKSAPAAPAQASNG